SSFAPDEQFAPQTIHLAPGKHVIEVSAPGYQPAREEIDVHPDEPGSITFTLHPEPGAAPAVIHAQPRRAEPSGPSVAPWILIGGGVVLGVAAVGYGLGELWPAHTRVEQAQSRVAFDALEQDFADKRWATLGL